MPIKNKYHNPAVIGPSITVYSCVSTASPNSTIEQNISVKESRWELSAMYFLFLSGFLKSICSLWGKSTNDLYKCKACSQQDSVPRTGTGGDDLASLTFSLLADEVDAFGSPAWRQEPWRVLSRPSASALLTT